MMPSESFDPEPALRLLKPFQRRTVDHVYKRFFKDPDQCRRFLVADEVGLGKTMVARGVIAKTLKHLWTTVPRIDVIYICSNQAIAEQNVKKLNVTAEANVARATRLTMLATQLGGDKGLDGNRINFISLTPATTLNLANATGQVRERALLLRLLNGVVEPLNGIRNLLQVDVKLENWRAQESAIWDDSVSVSEGIADRFRAELGRQKELTDELTELAELFWRRRRRWPEDLRHRRSAVIGSLRRLLAGASVHALEPDLIILDEFQRFADLLKEDNDDEAASLARDLFNAKDPDGNEARTLLLSATPYRMLTVASDAGDDAGDHYSDFLETLKFLYGKDRGPVVAAELDREFGRYRRALQAMPAAIDTAIESKLALEGGLSKALSRTERVRNTRDRDAMVKEVRLHADIDPDDLRHAAAVGRVARAIGAPNIVEYWKSAPYLLNFMRGYRLKDKLRGAANKKRPLLAQALKEARSAMLDRETIDAYGPVPMANGRMRALAKDLFDNGLAKRLWIPPSMPYVAEDDYDPSSTAATKALIFSSWSVVPDAIAALLSYEAERESGLAAAHRTYFSEIGQPLRFPLDDGRPTAFRTLLLLYPAPVLAAAFDPLNAFAKSGKALSHEAMRAEAARSLQPVLARLEANADPAEDHGAETWDWAGVSTLDVIDDVRTLPWLSGSTGLVLVGQDRDEKGGGFRAHIRALSAASQGRLQGKPSADAIEFLIDLALGSPAICALRTLHRIAPELDYHDPTLLSAAATVAWGFRSLFNQRESAAIVRVEEEGSYWRAVLRYGADMNLQAMLDEYVHFLVEAEGLRESSPQERVKALSEKMRAALSLRAAPIYADQIEVDEERIKFAEPIRLRGRFAMRLANTSDEEGSAQRMTSVRDAFNSPFRPFVLASTSIGQEGLDFHGYCYRIYHWNLPSNPVDLEQREGRIHRYKNHAVRLNIAQDYGHSIDPTAHDPWDSMFEVAAATQPDGNGLFPYWLYDGLTKVERRVPIFPYSREASRFEWLKRSLAVYRLAFGQPRQDDLLSFLESLGVKLSPEEVDALQINLAPPEV